MMGPWALTLGGPEPRGPHGVGAYGTRASMKVGSGIQDLRSKQEGREVLEL